MCTFGTLLVFIRPCPGSQVLFIMAHVACPGLRDHFYLFYCVPVYGPLGHVPARRTFLFSIIFYFFWHVSRLGWTFLGQQP